MSMPKNQKFKFQRQGIILSWMRPMCCISMPNMEVFFYQWFNTVPVYILMPTSSPGIQLFCICLSPRPRK